jgi:hypothetical protein
MKETRFEDSDGYTVTTSIHRLSWTTEEKAAWRLIFGPKQDWK